MLLWNVTTLHMVASKFLKCYDNRILAIDRGGVRMKLPAFIKQINISDILPKSYCTAALNIEEFSHTQEIISQSGLTASLANDSFNKTLRDFLFFQCGIDGTDASITKNNDGSPVVKLGESVTAYGSPIILVSFTRGAGYRIGLLAHAVKAPRKHESIREFHRTGVKFKTTHLQNIGISLTSSSGDKSLNDTGTDAFLDLFYPSEKKLILATPDNERLLLASVLFSAKSAAFKASLSKPGKGSLGHTILIDENRFSEKNGGFSSYLKVDEQRVSVGRTTTSGIKKTPIYYAGLSIDDPNPIEIQTFISEPYVFSIARMISHE